MPFVEREQAAIWYHDQGHGQAVLLVHGGLFDPMDGERFWMVPGIAQDIVAAGYRALVPDRRFSLGRSTAPFALHSWEIEAADLAAVLSAAGVEQAHVVAGSNGCSAAIHLALAVTGQIRSLVLCWPVAPDNDALRASFERSAALVERIGTAAYLDALRAQGAPDPDEGRTGYPWGLALLHDERLAASFRALGPAEAAATMRATAENLLAGDLLRGVSTGDANTLGRLGIPATIIPADPENAVHPLATAASLAAHIPGARLSRGFPESPTPGFPAVRAEYSAALRAVLRPE